MWRWEKNSLVIKKKKGATSSHRWQVVTSYYWCGKKVILVLGSN